MDTSGWEGYDICFRERLVKTDHVAIPGTCIHLKFFIFYFFSLSIPANEIESSDCGIGSNWDDLQISKNQLKING